MVKRTNPTLWRALRAEMFIHSKGRCRICGILLGLDSMQLDHIIPLADGGKQHDKYNLQCLCSCCHISKTSKENKERRGDSLR